MVKQVNKLGETIKIEAEQKGRKNLKYLKLIILPSLNTMIGSNCPPNGPNYLPYQPSILPTNPHPNNYPL